MHFIFWQNTLSIHQSAFLRNLADNHSVTLAVKTSIDTRRLKHGWNIPDFGQAQIVIDPDNARIDSLLDTPGAIHLFSGIQSFETVYKVFRMAVRKRLKIGIITEPYNWLGFKGKLRYLKYLRLRVRYAKHIHLVLATGSLAKWCFEIAGFAKSKIYDWAYFTETVPVTVRQNNTKQPSLLFIGSIDQRKNIIQLASVCKKLNIIDYLQIIGVGPLEKELQTILENTECKYLGAVSNKDVHGILENTDLLILPSVFDGWGAVVNEALMCGAPVAASNRCGASDLIRGDRGRVFSVKQNNMGETLMEFITQLPYTAEKRQAIREWALANISGEAAAQYFIRIIEHATDSADERPVAPWLRS